MHVKRCQSGRGAAAHRSARAHTHTNTHTHTHTHTHTKTRTNTQTTQRLWLVHLHLLSGSISRWILCRGASYHHGTMLASQVKMPSTAAAAAASRDLLGNLVHYTAACATTACLNAAQTVANWYQLLSPTAAASWSGGGRQVAPQR